MIGEGNGTHSNILAWETPWTEEPVGLQSMGLTRVRHNLATKPPPPKRGPNKLQELCPSQDPFTSLPKIA